MYGSVELKAAEFCIKATTTTMMMTPTEGYGGGAGSGLTRQCVGGGVEKKLNNDSAVLLYCLSFAHVYVCV